MDRGIIISAALLLAGAFTGSWAHDAEARYLGNEGVLVTSGANKVLFDAFYGDSYNLYALVPEALRADLMAGRPPNDGIDALFFSHVHGDHFSAAPTLAYLNAQPEVRLFASRQVVDALIAVAGEDHPVAGRLTAFDIHPGDPPQTAVVGDIRIDVAAIPHSGGRRHAHIRNLAFRVTLGDGPTVLHLGDSETDRDQFARLQSHWDTRRTDTAFPPYWFFGRDAGWEILTKQIKADQVIGIHVPAEAIGNGERWRKQAGADLFTDPGEARRIGGEQTTSIPDI